MDIDYEKIRRQAMCQTWVDLLPREKLSDLVRQIVLTNLARNEGNRTHTARGLGISLRGLRNMINEFEAAGHEVPESRYVGFGWARAASNAEGYPSHSQSGDTTSDSMQNAWRLEDG